MYTPLLPLEIIKNKIRKAKNETKIIPPSNLPITINTFNFFFIFFIIPLASLKTQSRLEKLVVPLLPVTKMYFYFFFNSTGKEDVAGNP